jgi:CDP-diacylglycerol--glycerol-3-phosphate 3-phosphatidyltransferase
MRQRTGDEKNRTFTVANGLTVFRLALSAAAGPLFFTRRLEGVALLLCAIAVVLDWVDGWVARRLAQQSMLGAFLDPAADKVAMIVVYGVMAIRAGSTVVWSLFVLLIARDVSVTARRCKDYFAAGSLVAADAVGKFKTCVESMGGLTVLGYAYYVNSDFSFSSLPTVVLFAGVGVLSYVSWVRYWLVGRGGKLDRE